MACLGSRLGLLASKRFVANTAEGIENGAEVPAGLYLPKS